MCLLPKKEEWKKLVLSDGGGHDKQKNKKIYRMRHKTARTSNEQNLAYLESLRYLNRLFVVHHQQEQQTAKHVIPYLLRKT